jgi:hypothetical protein
MEKLIIIIIFLVSQNIIYSQSDCSELIKYVKSEDYGSTYYSYNSDAITKVTFYDVTENFQTYYFAIVKFKDSYKEYIYQVGSNTKFNYSLHYLESAGKAFWEYIQPYNENIQCGPDFN